MTAQGGFGKGFKGKTTPFRKHLSRKGICGPAQATTPDMHDVGVAGMKLGTRH